MLVEETPSSARSSRRAAANSASVFFAQLISLGASMGVTILMARHLGRDGFGLFSYALVFVNIFAMLADFGMQTILVREMARPRWDPAELLSGAVFIKGSLSLIAIALTITAAWAIGYPHKLFVVITILAFSIPVSFKFYTFRAIFESHFNATLRMQVPMLFQLLDSLLLLGVIAALVYHHASLEPLVMAYVLCYLPGFLLTVYVATRRIKIRRTFSKKLIAFLLKESLPLWIYTILMTLAVSVDSFLLRELQGEAALGVYSAALRLTSPLLFIPQGIAASFLPLLSRYHQESPGKKAFAFNLGIKITLLPAVALAVAATFLGAELIQLLYSEAYSDSAEPLIILMWSQAFFFLGYFLTNALTSTDLQRMAYPAAAAMLLSNSAASSILIQKLGANGAAIAKFVSHFVGFVVLVISTRKTFSLDWDQLIFKSIRYGLFLAVIFALLRHLHSNIFFVGAIGFLFMISLAWAVLNRDERALFSILIRRTSLKSP